MPISLNNIMHNKLTPLTNNNVSSDAFPITTTPTTVTPANPVDMKDDMNPVTLANTMVNTCTAVIHVPCDLSSLCSSALNPWVSLQHCYYGYYPHTACQFTHQRWYPPIYPANSYLHTTLTQHTPPSLLLTFSKQFSTHTGSGQTNQSSECPYGWK